MISLNYKLKALFMSTRQTVGYTKRWLCVFHSQSACLFYRCKEHINRFLHIACLEHLHILPKLNSHNSVILECLLHGRPYVRSQGYKNYVAWKRIVYFVLIQSTSIIKEKFYPHTCWESLFSIYTLIYSTVKVTNL